MCQANTSYLKRPLTDNRHLCVSRTNTMFIILTCMLNVSNFIIELQRYTFIQLLENFYGFKFSFKHYTFNAAVLKLHLFLKSQVRAHSNGFAAWVFYRKRSLTTCSFVSHACIESYFKMEHFFPLRLITLEIRLSIIKNRLRELPLVWQPQFLSRYFCNT